MCVCVCVCVCVCACDRTHTLARVFICACACAHTHTLIIIIAENVQSAFSDSRCFTNLICFFKHGLHSCKITVMIIH